MPRFARWSRWLIAALLLSSCGGGDDPAPTTTTTTKASNTTVAAAAPGIHVVGTGFVRDGKPTVLRGLNRSGTEYMCNGDAGEIFDGPSDAQSIEVMASWEIDVVRVPLNEHCWLDLPTVAGPRGSAYRDAIAGYVSRLHDAGLLVILDLHANAPGTDFPAQFTTLPDADHAPAFWRSVAAQFKDDPNVLFEVFNEPHVNEVEPTPADWACWRDGCETTAEVHTSPTAKVSRTYRAAGMQDLIDAVRSTGAKQPIILDGLAWANDLSGWLDHRPKDPERQLIAGFHLYNFNRCASAACWERIILKVAREVPLLTTEVGEDDCRSTFTVGYAAWADSHDIGYLGWTWNAAQGRVESDTQWSCKGGPSLIEEFDGTPTPFGAGFKDHLAKLAAAGR